MSLAKQSAVAGAPGVLVVKDAAGQEHTLLVNKPSATDLILMRKWVLAQPLPEGGAGQGLTSEELGGLKPEERVLLIREYARAKGTRREPTEGEATQLVYSAPGVAMQVWLAARRHHPGLTKEAVAKLVTEANWEQVISDLDAAVGADEDPDDPKAPGGPPSSPPS